MRLRGIEGEVQKNTIMKKLLTNLLLAVLLNGLLSAAPANCTSVMNVSNISKINFSESDDIQQQEEEAFEIHPLDILSFRFY